MVNEQAPQNFLRRLLLVPNVLINQVETNILLSIDV